MQSQARSAGLKRSYGLNAGFCSFFMLVFGGASSLSAQALPDLVISSGSPTATPSSVSAGGTVRLSPWTVKNQGSATSGGFSNGFYLSTDATISTADTYLDGNSNTGLAPGASFNWGGPSLTIPAGIAPGNYYIGILVDVGNSVSESNEGNNYVGTPITVTGPSGQPDLVISSGTPAATPSSVAPGGVVQLSPWTVRNQGTATSGNFSNGFYLSNDAVVTAGDVYLTGNSNTGLAPGGSFNWGGPSLTIPAGTAPGNYYIGILVDAGNSVNESNESNNYVSTAITVSGSSGQPDLVISSGTPSATPSSVAPGGSIQLSAWTVRNQGSGVAYGIFSNGFYLSPDAIITANDFYLTGNGNNDLAPGAAFNWGGPTLTIPSGTAPGNYFIGILVDRSNLLTESNEANNYVSTLITVTGPTGQPDIVISSGTPTVTPSSVAAGASVQLSAWTVRNQGTATGSDFSNGFYLSTDPVIAASDIYLDGNGNTGLAPGTAFNWGGPTLTIPAGTAPGNYYLGILVDRSNLITESNETNNFVSTPITVTGPSQPDLIISSGTPTATPSTVAAGAAFQLSAWTVRNQGMASSGDFSNGFYLSIDAVITASDIYLTGNSNTSLNAGASFNWGGPTLTIPAATVPRNYYIGILVDRTNAVVESNEGNNYVSVPITVTGPSGQPDLVISSGALTATPSSVADGGSVQLSAWIVKNQGTVVSDDFSNGFYLSTDAVITSADVYLTGNSNSGLAPGASFQWGGPTLTIPAGTASGNYYLGILVDRSNLVTEANETNNYVSTPIAVIGSSVLPDLTISSGTPTATPSTVAAGAAFQLSAWTVRNQGTASTGTFSSGFYLSTDAVITPADVYLTGNSNSGLAPGASFNWGGPTLTIPGGFASGNYYLGILLDRTNSVSESNESNNYVSTPITVIGTTPITLSNINPASGPLTGGTTIVITGSGFRQGLSVAIGGVAASVSLIAPAQINATTGIGFLPGLFDVTVINPGGAPASLKNAFTYTSVVPKLSSLSPSSRLEGEPSFNLVVTGNNFTSGAQIHWNGSPRVTRFVSSAQIEASIPTSDILAPGTAQVSVSIGGSASADSLLFTIAPNNAPPELIQVLPESGSTQGNTKISLLGRNFKPQLVVSNPLIARSRTKSGYSVEALHEHGHCSFSLGGQCITGLVFVNNGELRGDAPPGSSGTVEAAYVREDGTQSVVGQAFTYKTLPSVPPPSPSVFGPKIRQRIPFVADTREFRTNLGINNLTNSPATMEILLSNSNGEVVAQKSANVAAHGMTQINDVIRFLEDALTMTGREGYLILESVSDLRAWASQIDNLTNDPSIQQTRHEAAAASHVLIPSSASINQFLTSLIIINNSPVAGQVTIRGRRNDGAIQAELLNQAIKANGYLYFEDFYDRVGLSAVSGPIEIESNNIKITATTRIYTREGTSGYFEGVDIGQASRISVLPFTLDTLEFRTNLGITNPGHSEANVTVSLLDRDGLTVNSLQTTVPAHGMTQINRINQALSQSGEAYLRLTSDQPVFGWTSQIDNLTNDLSLVVGKTPSNVTRLLIPSTTNAGIYRSTTVVINLGSAATAVLMTSRDNDGNVRGSTSVTIPGNGFVSYADILSALNLSESFGPLEILSTDGNPIQAVSRVYSTQRTGGYFEGVAVQNP